MQLHQSFFSNPIREQQYGLRTRIEFSTFDSCIGVVASLSGSDKLIGVHLVMVLRTNVLIGLNDIADLEACLRRYRYNRHHVLILGHCSLWQDSVPPVWQRILQVGANPTIRDLGNGRFSVLARGRGWYVMNH